MGNKAIYTNCYEIVSSTDYFLYIFIGGRGIGKSYSMLSEAYKHHDMIMYVRRTDTELKNCCDEFTNPYKSINQKIGSNISIKPNKDNALIIEKIDEDHSNLIGYASALSTFGKFRGADFSDVNLIIFDEFIVDKGCIRYLTNEVDVFLDLFETIARKRNNVKAYLLANNVSIVNPYFTYFDVAPKKTERFTIARDGELVIEMCTDTVFINEKLETKFGKLIKGTKYADYSIYNNSLRDSEVFIEKRPKRNTSPVMSITYNSETAMVWLDYKTGIFYCDDKYMKTCNEYVLSCDDHNPNTLLNASGINLNMLKQLISYFQVGRVRFSDQNVKHLMYDVFRSLGVK